MRRNSTGILNFIALLPAIYVLLAIISIHLIFTYFTGEATPLLYIPSAIVGGLKYITHIYIAHTVISAGVLLVNISRLRECFSFIVMSIISYLALPVLMFYGLMLL